MQFETDFGGEAFVTHLATQLIAIVRFGMHTHRAFTRECRIAQFTREMLLLLIVALMYFQVGFGCETLQAKITSVLFA